MGQKMIYDYDAVLCAIDTRLSETPPEQIPQLLRPLPLAVWGELLLEIPAIPKPQSILPVDAVKANLALSEDVPVVLPCRGPFDLIYAFSVFTHLSEKTTNAVLNILSSFRLYRLFLFISFAAATFFVDNPVF